MLTINILKTILAMCQITSNLRESCIRDKFYLNLRTSPMVSVLLGFLFTKSPIRLNGSMPCDMTSNFIIQILVLLLYMSFQKRVAWKPKMLHGYFGLAMFVRLVKYKHCDNY